MSSGEDSIEEDENYSETELNEGDESDDLDSGEDQADEEDDDDENGVQHFTGPTPASNKDAESGEAVKVQLAIWDGLLETRIKLQKPLALCNTLPPSAVFPQFVANLPEDSSVSVAETCSSLRTLLQDLAGFQDLINKNNPALLQKSVDSDEEINSDSEGEDVHSSLSATMNDFINRNSSLSEIEKLLEKRYRSLEPSRNSILEKWHGKTHQFSVGHKKNFSAFDQSPVKQIEQIMADPQRLIGRTQTPRTSYHVLGTGESHVPITEALKVNKGSTLNPEIFDDDDFYHILLRELIERKAGDLSDPIELSRQQIQLAQLRKHTKKVVDSKATRDRKVKFEPHPKLISFMASQPSCRITEQARNDIYKSLFGKLQQQPDNDMTFGLSEIRLLK